MATSRKKGFNPVHAALEPLTGLYLNLEDQDHPRLAVLGEASTYPSHLDVCTALAAVRAPLPPYEVERVDA